MKTDQLLLSILAELQSIRELLEARQQKHRRKVAQRGASKRIKTRERK
jgi:hypothetical protein